MHINRSTYTSVYTHIELTVNSSTPGSNAHIIGACHVSHIYRHVCISISIHLQLIPLSFPARLVACSRSTNSNTRIYKCHIKIFISFQIYTYTYINKCICIICVFCIWIGKFHLRSLHT